ncbi:hypothetical protein L596_004163 [Steinernema carpocapsae]|uniref:Protein SERAC1 n=1 Tax=Steinernema carpocapsae TaxID=34508 RepID=A0A4U8UUY6_STECR|nr:hypothetical protein L596_004163 [Steinernema carpocapsae]
MSRNRILLDVGLRSALTAFFLGSGRQLNREEKVSERRVINAINSLNSGENIPTAVRVLEDLSWHDQSKAVKCLSNLALCILAANESSLCRVASQSDAVGDRACIRAELLEKLENIILDDDWNKALLWYSVNACAEDDPVCNDVTLLNRPSNVRKLTRLLQVLYNKTELHYSSQMVDQEALEVLLELFQHFYPNNMTICVLILKILSNISTDGAYCAESVAASGWMKLLLFMLNEGSEIIPILCKKIFLNLLYSMEQKKTCLGSGLYEFYSTSYCTNPEIDVVLLHGMRGSAFRTWRQKDDPGNVTTQCWPKVWLPNSVQGHIRIIAVDYPSALYGGDLMENLQSRAKRVLEFLERAGIGDRPVVFICHSMGGLLAKQLLIGNTYGGAEKYSLFRFARFTEANVGSFVHGHSSLRHPDRRRIFVPSSTPIA